MSVFNFDPSLSFYSKSTVEQKKNDYETMKLAVFNRITETLKKADLENFKGTVTISFLGIPNLLLLKQSDYDQINDSLRDILWKKTSDRGWDFVYDLEAKCKCLNLTIEPYTDPEFHPWM